jgi:hypothetical protein
MYAKVFRSLWDGTLADSWSCWSVFVFLLAHCDMDGVVEMTPGAIARRSCIPADEVERALEKLLAPDPNSRSSAEGGRRIVPLDSRGWGWRIVNHARYRSLRDEQERRQQNREAQARHRESAAVSHRQPPSSHTEAEADTEADSRSQKAGESKARESGRKSARPPLALPTLDEVRSYCAERVALGKPRIDPDAWFDHFSANGWKVSGKSPMKDWQAAVRNWERREGTFGGRSSGLKPSRGRQIIEAGLALKAEEIRHEQG